MSILINNRDSIVRKWIRKANGMYKYNPGFHRMLEEVTGEPSDRGAEDIGVERDHVDYSHIEDSESNEPY